MSNHQVPFPALSAISDPAVRRAIQAIYEELRLRRGETGNGEDKFVTQTELTTALKK